MRVRLSNCSFILGSLICIASIGSGCTQLSNPSLPSQSDSSISTSPVAIPGRQEFPAFHTGGEKQLTGSTKSQSTTSGEWLLQPGLFGAKNGMWLGCTSLAFGLFGIGSAVFFRFELVRLTSQINDKLLGYDKNIKAAYAAINKLSKQRVEDSAKSDRLLSDYQQLESKHASILASINNLRIQQKPEPQSYDFPAQIPLSTPPAVIQSYVLSPAQKQAELTAAVNRGDRQIFKSEICAQLNITHASENAISMGRLNETQLEEVSAGGSYWSASFGGETWLYPTEQTLKGYTQSQRPTGIFNYTRQPIHSAQVVSPARLTLSGTLWQVAEIGTIAVPG